MTIRITRRDFLNGMVLGTGAVLLELPAPLRLFAQSNPGYGFSGIGDYASSNGNTAAVINAFQAIENGDYTSLSKDIIDTGESYDLIIVGGGLSGLGQPMNLKSPLHSRQNVLFSKTIRSSAAQQREMNFWCRESGLSGRRPRTHLA